MLYEYSLASDYKPVRGVKDKRVTDPKLSLAWRMLRMAGLVDHGNLWEDLSNPLWQDFISLFTQWMNGVTMTRETENRLDSCIRELRKAVLQRADIVCCTVSGLGEAAVYESLHPQLIVIDEASQLLEAESIIPIAWFDTQALFIGDPSQTKPSVQMEVKISGKTNARCLSSKE